MAVPANCTLSAAEDAARFQRRCWQSPLAAQRNSRPESTPRLADDGPLRVVPLTLRSNCPALARMQVGVGQPRPEARELDIQIVFQRQRDGVREREVDAPGAHQLIQRAEHW